VKRLPNELLCGTSSFIYLFYKCKTGAELVANSFNGQLKTGRCFVATTFMSKTIYRPYVKDEH